MKNGSKKRTTSTVKITGLDWPIKIKPDEWFLEYKGLGVREIMRIIMP